MEMSDNVMNISTAAASTGIALVKNGADELVKLSSSLSTLVGQFKI